MQLKFFSILSVFLVFNTLAQKDSTTVNMVDKSAAFLQLEQGKTHFNESNFLKAIISFRNAAGKDPSSWRPQFWLAKTHYNLANYGYSLRYGREAYLKDSVNADKEINLILAQSYHRLEKLDSAVLFYEKSLMVMSKKDASIFDIQLKLDQAKYAQSNAKTEKFAEKTVLSKEVNTGHNDYAPVLSQDGKILYFTSRRNNTIGGGQNPYDELFYEDIYRAVWNDEIQTWDSISNRDILGRVNKTGFESMSWLSEDGTIAYITINNEAVNEKITTRSSDIFEIKMNAKDVWGAPRAALTSAINSDGFDAGATITADGNTMYFVSDRNLKNGSDIYVSKRVGKSWGIPMPLPAEINTVGNETTPFITPDGKYLFFSSDTHQGMGGYDIFVSKNLGGNSWSKPENLGPAVNSVNNDTHFQYYPHLNKAMFAQQIISGMKSNFDIFEIETTDLKLP